MASPYRTALITGASSGLGRGLSLYFAEKGVKVLAAARREDRLRELAEEASRTTGDAERIVPVPLDVADTERTVASLRELDALHGGIDLVIANAGLGLKKRATRVEWSALEQLLQVNVLGASATLMALVPRMAERGRGQLVGISSLAGWCGMPKAPAYSGSKAYLAVFLEGLRVELKGSGIDVTTIYPGFVKSEMTAENAFKMPFLLETDVAVRMMGKAIERGDAELAFPWQLSSTLRAVKSLPKPLYDAVARRFF